MIDAFASERHYLAHLQPIVEALGADFGALYLSDFLATQLAERGEIDGDAIIGPPAPSDRPLLVASAKDMLTARDRWIVFLEHGVGQTYGDRNPSSPGGNERERVILFLCPNERVAHANAAVYPGSRTAVIGCPKLDARSSTAPPDAYRFRGDGQVCISFHWDNPQHEAALSAFPHYRDALPGLKQALGNRLIGHSHPRVEGMVRPVYESAGIEYVSDFDEVLARADLYVCDTSSTLYEFAAVKGPVLCLNAPWYRSGYETGLWPRFVTAPGLLCDGPEQLLPMIELALADPVEGRDARVRAVAEAYVSLDGQASARAAAAITETLAGLDLRRNPVSETDPYAPLHGVVTPPKSIPAVPGGSAKDVLAWVGADPLRARAALRAEAQRGDAARSSLVAKLERLVAA